MALVKNNLIFHIYKISSYTTFFEMNQSKNQYFRVNFVFSFDL